jgi:Tol biopolymer transport system component
MSPNQTSSESRVPTFILVAIIVVLLVIVVYKAAKIIENKLAPAPSVPTEVTKKELPEGNIGLNDSKLTKSDVAGLLIFSGQSNGNNDLKTYSLRFLSDKPELINESDYFKIPSSSFVEFENTVNPRNFYFKVFTNSTSSTGEPSVVNTLYHANIPNTIDVITDEPGQEFGTVAWSPAAGLLSYMSLKDENLSDIGDRSGLDKWKVIVADSANKIQFEIENAAHPTWSPDGTKLLYTKSDGFYYRELSTGLENRLLQIVSNEGKELTTGTMFDLSYDGKTLVLTTSGQGYVDIYDVSEKPLTLNLIGRIVNPEVNYRWPVISPDGKTYAVVTSVIDGGNLTNPKVEIRPIDGRNVLVSYGLGNFNPALVFLDDWIAKPIEF